MKKLLSILIVSVLLCGCIFLFVGCGDKEEVAWHRLTLHFDYYDEDEECIKTHISTHYSIWRNVPFLVKHGEKLDELSLSPNEEYIYFRGADFLGWFDESGKKWDFDKDTVTSKTNLYARCSIEGLNKVEFLYPLFDESGNSVFDEKGTQVWQVVAGDAKPQFIKPGKKVLREPNVSGSSFLSTSFYGETEKLYNELFKTKLLVGWSTSFKSSSPTEGELFWDFDNDIVNGDLTLFAKFIDNPIYK